MSDELKKIIFYPLSQFNKDSQYSDYFNEVNRKIRVSYLKEEESMDFILGIKICTKEEYDSILASNSIADALLQTQEEASLRDIVVIGTE